MVTEAAMSFAQASVLVMNSAKATTTPGNSAEMTVHSMCHRNKLPRARILLPQRHCQRKYCVTLQK
eukprot:3277251-Rhodomonas_salina.1